MLKRTADLQQDNLPCGSGIGAKIRAGEMSLEELAAYACEMGAPELPGSGRQEYLESVVNNVMFAGI